MQHGRRRLPADQLAFAGGLTLAIAVLVMFGFVDLARGVVHNNDFAGFWAGPRAALDGVDPYDPDRFPGVVLRYRTQETEPVYGYPPWDLLLLLPFALLPLEVASPVWTILGMAVAIYGVGALLARCAPRMPAVHFLAGVALLASQPAIVTFYSGQWGFFLTGALALAMRIYVSAPTRSGAIGAVTFAVKPQLFLFAAWALTRTAVARRTYVSVATGAAVGLSFIATGWLLFPRWLGPFLQYIEPARTSDPPRSVTLATPLAEALGPAAVWFAVPLLAIVLVVGLRFDPRSQAWTAIWLALSITLTTYGWSYDHLALIVPIILGVGAALAAPRRARLIGILGLLTLLVEALLVYQLAPLRGSQSLNALVPLTVFAILAIALWPYRTAPRIP